nr:hypothetical protein CFP56_64169 [Quercus suber]
MRLVRRDDRHSGGPFRAYRSSACRNSEAVRLLRRMVIGTPVVEVEQALRPTSLSSTVIVSGRIQGRRQDTVTLWPPLNGQHSAVVQKHSTDTYL